MAGIHTSRTPVRAWKASMRILYGIVGEGMGHATRSRVVLEHLLGQGHEVLAVVSGRAHRFLEERMGSHPGIRFEEISGFSVVYEGNAVDRVESFWANIEKAPETLLRNVQVFLKVSMEGFRPQVVITDFESWALIFAYNKLLPIISIDNMSVIDRCRHDEEIQGDPGFLITKTAVKVKIPAAWHYLVTSFFFPPVRKARTTLVPPILRPEILAARREPGEHVLVYRTATSPPDMLSVLRRLPGRFRVYGGGGEGQDENVTLCAFSEAGFMDDLRRAKAVIASGGFSLMSEAIHLGVPLFAIPIEQQFEQRMNCRYLSRLGYGSWTPELDQEAIADFLGRLPTFERALAGFPRQDNAMTMTCLDELLRGVEEGIPAPERLRSVSMGCFPGTEP